MKVVTAGPTFLDIDAYGGCVAYAELLRLQGEEAVAASTAVLNESITPTVRSWPVEFKTDYVAQPTDKFILIDVSDPEQFDTFVKIDQIDEIIDHHPEFADYWPPRLGERARIEFIGAACTQVYERWAEAGLVGQMSETSARLLMSGILDNTLNFHAVITTERDKTAYAELAKLAGLPEDWPRQYFEECQQGALKDLSTTLKNDSKNIFFASLGRKVLTSQLLLWDAGDVVVQNLANIKEQFAGQNDEWFVNVISLNEGKNYVLASNPTVQDFIKRVLRVSFEGGVATSERLWLRKEIVKQDMQQESVQ